MAKKKKKEEIPELAISENATLREIYAKIREQFSAADLQKYTEIEEGIPAEQLLVELEEIQRKESQKLKKKP